MTCPVLLDFDKEKLTKFINTEEIYSLYVIYNLNSVLRLLRIMYRSFKLLYSLTHLLNCRQMFISSNILFNIYIHRLHRVNCIILFNFR